MPWESVLPGVISPGVYVLEKPPTSVPIAGVQTAVAAFVGFTAYVGGAAAANAPYQVVSYAEFTKNFGDVTPDAYLPYSVRAFFRNGGRIAHIVSIKQVGPTAELEGLRFSATAPGMSVTLTGVETTVAVKVNSGDRVVEEAKVDASGTKHEVAVRLNSALTQLGVTAVDRDSTDAFGSAGPTELTVAAPTAGDSGTPELAPPATEIAGLRFTAKNPGSPTLSVTVEPSADGTGFSVKVAGDGVEPEALDGLLPAGTGKNQPVTRINAESKLVNVAAADPSTQFTLPTEAASGEILAAVGISAAMVSASDPQGTPDFVGNDTARTGVMGLEAIDEITMICVPDLVRLDERAITMAQKQLYEHCERLGDRMAILDPPPNKTVQDIIAWHKEANYDTRYAALYWPWVEVESSPGKTIAVPPSGHVAGLWTASDDSVGVHKAPANEPALKDVVKLAYSASRREHDSLHPQINAIRSFPGRGIRVWGARTLSSDMNWKYINLRRYFNYLEESILLGTQWCVFEPNDAALWGRIERTIKAFLALEWRKGALFGLSPNEAFHVACNEQTNPSELIDRGVVTCVVAVAPVKPAEFVVFELSQFSGGSSLVE